MKNDADVFNTNYVFCEKPNFKVKKHYKNNIRRFNNNRNGQNAKN